MEIKRIWPGKDLPLQALTLNTTLLPVFPESEVSPVLSAAKCSQFVTFPLSLKYLIGIVYPITFFLRIFKDSCPFPFRVLENDFFFSLLI